MRAGEHQGKAFVGDRRLVFFAGRELGQQEQMIGGALARLPTPRRVDQFAPRDGQQPSLGVRGMPSTLRYAHSERIIVLASGGAVLRRTQGSASLPRNRVSCHTI